MTLENLAMCLIFFKYFILKYFGKNITKAYMSLLKCIIHESHRIWSNELHQWDVTVRVKNKNKIKQFNKLVLTTTSNFRSVEV
jgi:hypothetical protein